jgi:hypothetical protein
MSISKTFKNCSTLRIKPDSNLNIKFYTLENMIINIDFLGRPLEKIKKRYNITNEQIFEMIEDGELVLPIQDYTEAIEILKNGLDGEWLDEHFVYRLDLLEPPDKEKLLKARIKLAQKRTKYSPASEYIDGATNNGFWPLGILNYDYASNITLGFIDFTPLHPWHKPFAGINVTNYICSSYNCITPDYLPIVKFDSHGILVPETSIKFLPGVRNIDIFSDKKLKHHGYNIHKILWLKNIFLQIQQRLEWLESNEQHYAYLLNFSMSMNLFLNPKLSISDLLLKQPNDIYDEKEFVELYNLIQGLHIEYPRFQLFMSAGNDPSIPPEPLNLMKNVFAIGGHNIDFHDAQFSYGDNVFTSALASKVETFGEKMVSGTSFSAPTMQAMSGIIMGLIKDLKNYELKAILKELSVPTKDFFTPKYKILVLKTPVFIFDLVKFVRIIERDYHSRIDPDLLRTLQHKANNYYTIKLTNDIEYIIPNLAKVEYDVGDKVYFDMHVANNHRTPQSITFLFSSHRLAPNALCDGVRNFMHINLPEHTLLSKKQSLEIPGEFTGNISVQAIRYDSNKLFYSYLINGREKQNGFIKYYGDANDGSLEDVMLGISSPTNNIKILQFSGLKPSNRNTPSSLPSRNDNPEFSSNTKTLFLRSYNQPSIENDYSTKNIWPFDLQEATIFTLGLLSLLSFHYFCKNRHLDVKNMRRTFNP